MRARVSRHIRTNTVGYVALFFALSGGAYALQGKNTIDSGDIKKGQVKSSDVANDSRKGALTGTDIAANSLTGRDIKERALGPVPSATSADNADQLDGQDSSAFLGANAAGVPIAGAAIDADGTVQTFFNRVGGAPTVVHSSGGGFYILTFPGLEGRVGDSTAVALVSLHGGSDGMINRGSNPEGNPTVRTRSPANVAEDKPFDIVIVAVD